MPRILVFAFLILACFAGTGAAQKKKPSKGKASEVTVPDAQPANPLHILGIRPGITLDSVTRVLALAGVSAREVKEDTLTKTYGGAPMRVFVVDSIICRLTYMRLVFLIDGTGRIRRMSITPRQSSIDVGANDDVENVLLLYFGQTWGKPELNLEPPVPNFRWRTGNIQVRGFIRRGYPLWVMEG